MSVLDKKADCTITMADLTYWALMTGKMNPQTVRMMVLISCIRCVLVFFLMAQFKRILHCNRQTWGLILLGCGMACPEEGTHMLFAWISPWDRVSPLATVHGVAKMDMT